MVDEVAHELGQVRGRAPETVELRHHDDVTGLCVVEKFTKSWTVRTRAGGLLDIHVPVVDPRGPQCVTLSV
ncbi:hypothetical protein D3C74_489630 [compost metagenome]